MFLVLSSHFSQISFTFFLTYSKKCDLMNMEVVQMAIGKRIKEARLNKSLTQEDLAKLIGVTKGAIANYENNTSHPREQIIYALMDTLDVDANFLFQDHVKIKTAPSLSDEAMTLAKDYDDKLDPWGQKAVRGLADTEILRCEAERLRQITQKDTEFSAELLPVVKTIPLIGSSFAAGRGDPDFGNPWEDYKVPIDTVADFAVRINGDSMEPYLPDGSIQLCRKGFPADGEVGALLVDGEFLCKQVCKDLYDNLNLFSLNRDRADADQTILHDSGRSVSCFGTVIMHERIPLPDCLGR
jgi:transcriptional regulator with XRE-family HTH domain